MLSDFLACDQKLAAVTVAYFSPIQPS